MASLSALLITSNCYSLLRHMAASVASKLFDVDVVALLTCWLLALCCSDVVAWGRQLARQIFSIFYVKSGKSSHFVQSICVANSLQNRPVYSWHIHSHVAHKIASIAVGILKE